MKNIAQIFLNNIKTRRKELGLTQKELAEIIDCSEKTISHWEVGTAIAPSMVLPELAAALGIDINALFEDTSDPEYFLGICGDSYGTQFLLADKNGNKINEVILETINHYHTGFDYAFSMLDNGIKKVCGKIPLRKISAFAGLRNGMGYGIYNKYNEFLKEYGFAWVDNSDDKHCTLELALGNDYGIAAIIDDTVISFVNGRDYDLRRGGYGYLIEKGGGRYSIGRDGVYYAREAEELGKKSILKKIVLEDT